MNAESNGNDNQRAVVPLYAATISDTQVSHDLVRTPSLIVFHSTFLIGLHPRHRVRVPPVRIAGSRTVTVTLMTH